MGLAVAFLLVGIIIGFLLGTRGRQIAASGKAILQNMPSMFSFKIPPQAEAEDEGKDDNEALGNDEAERPTDIMEEFLARGAESGLDDHPDLEINPVIMYQIKEAKAAKRIEQMRAALREEGMTEEEVDERMYLAAMGGANPASTGKPSAFQVLIDVGARFTSASSSSNEAALVQERKRQVRTIDVFLNKERGIDTGKDTGNKISRSANAPSRQLDARKAGERPKSAYQVALESKINQKDHSQWLSSEMVGVAKRGRNLIRERKNKVGYVYVPEKKEAKELKQEKQERAGKALNADDLASIAAEFEGGKLGKKINFDDEGEEGEEEDDKEDEGEEEDAAPSMDSDEEFLRS